MPGSGEERTVTLARVPAAKSLVRWLVTACREGVPRLIRRCQSARARVDFHDLAAALLFGTLLILVGTTFGDYAISNDEEVQQRYGELIVAYYASGFADHALFHFKDLYLYGGLFDVVAVGLEKLLPLDTYAVRHLLSALTGVGGIVAAWATARAVGGPRAGLVAAVALAVCGIWYGAMFNHTKDIPFAAAMMGATYFLLRLARELPRPRWRLVLLFAVLCGCALGLRVLGLFLISYAGLAVAAYAPIGPGRTWRGVLDFVTRSMLSLAPAFLIAYAIMIAAWPWAGLAPLNPLRAMSAFVNLHYPIHTILAGREYRMADVPRWYEPTYVAIKLTLPLLVGAGLAVVLAMGPRRFGPATNQAWRKETAFVAVAAFFPLICDVVMRGPAFSGMRHVLFTAPPIAVLAGLGLNGALCRLAAANRLAAAVGLAFLLLGLGFDATTLYRLHPDEYLYFNPLVGGLHGASRRYATDYWVNVMPEAVADLEHYLDRTERTSGKPPRRRRYSVVVCGERLPFEKVADARLQWTSDWDRADFFIAPTHMNCDRALNGRIVATVKRLGVPIGVVKDRRAITHPSLARNH
jgi:Dolichyl-phosphate-mannose-protein mannosyltransferase